MGYPVEPSQIVERLQLISGSTDHIVYVAESNQKLVGWIHANVRLLIESSPFVEICGLVIDSANRGEGISLQKNLEFLRCFFFFARAIFSDFAYIVLDQKCIAFKGRLNNLLLKRSFLIWNFQNYRLRNPLINFKLPVKPNSWVK